MYANHMNTAAALAPQYLAELNKLIEHSIETGWVNRRLFAACKRAGYDYNEVVEHIGAEVAANA